jgi:hypothetical protein
MQLVPGRIKSVEAAETAAQFILSEIRRINELPVEARMERIRTDRREGFGFLSAPPEYPLLECGRAALEQTVELTRYVRKSTVALAGNASADTVHSAFVKRFVERFVKHGHELTKSSLMSVLQKTVNEITARMAPRTIVMPCLLWQWEHPPQFSIGPVEFVRAKSFFDDPNNRLFHPEDSASAQAKALAEKAGWVAVVTVSTMDDQTAERRARACVDAAISVIKLFVDPDRTRECRRADTWGPAPNHGLFRRDETGGLSCTMTYGGVDALGWENWATCFEGQSGILLKIAQGAVFGLLEPRPRYPLQLRFLDALKWFGDGVSEASSAARIIKYVFAWERLVITRKHVSGDGPALTTVVCNRIQFLCERILGEPRGEVLLKEIETLYDVRSCLAHGSVSPWAEEELRAHAAHAEKVTVRALLGALLHYWALNGGGGSEKELENSFEPPQETNRSPIADQAPSPTTGDPAA